MAAYFGIHATRAGVVPPAVIGQRSAAHPVVSERQDPTLTATRIPIIRLEVSQPRAEVGYSRAIRGLFETRYGPEYSVPGYQKAFYSVLHPSSWHVRPAERVFHGIPGYSRVSKGVPLSSTIFEHI